MKIREEYFTAFKDGREECLCRIRMPSGEGGALGELLGELCDRARTACETGYLVGKHEKDAQTRERFSVTPYRYACTVTPYEVGEGILSFKIEASFDARFPGGVHLNASYGFLYDEKNEIVISAVCVIPLAMRRVFKGKGKPFAVYADEEGIHLLFGSGEETVFSTDGFLSYYRLLGKYVSKGRKKRKKVLTK